MCIWNGISANKKGYIVNYYANAVGSTSAGNIEKAIKKLNKKCVNIIHY